MFRLSSDMPRPPRHPPVRLSACGQLTLPAKVRKALKLRAGDTFCLRIEENKIILETTQPVPTELYSAVRTEEFRQNAEMTDDELTRARAAWGLWAFSGAISGFVSWLGAVQIREGLAKMPQHMV